jgi:hypothetical protein
MNSKRRRKQRRREEQAEAEAELRGYSDHVNDVMSLAARAMIFMRENQTEAADMEFRRNFGEALRRAHDGGQAHADGLRDVLQAMREETLHVVDHFAKYSAEKRGSGLCSVHLEILNFFGTAVIALEGAIEEYMLTLHAMMFSFDEVCSHEEAALGGGQPGAKDEWPDIIGGGQHGHNP